MIKYKIEKDINKIDASKLETLLNKSKYANAFHTRKMYDLWDSVEGYEPFIIVCTDAQKDIKTIISGVIHKEKGKLQGFFSKRSIIYGGPVMDEEDSNIKLYLEHTLEFTSKYLRNKSIYIETRNLNDYSQYKEVFQQCEWKYNTHLNFKVDCREETEIRKRMSKSKIRQVNKSLKSGAEIILATEERQVIEFYEILKDLYSTKVNKPLLHKDFFINFFKKDIGKYLLVKFENKIIGGIMCPVFSNKVIYELFIAGEDGQYKNIYPSVVATWAAIDFANKNSIKIFDFMGAGKPDQNYGVREFKSKFGGELVEHGRFIKILNPILFKIGKLGLKIYSKVK